MDHEHATTPFFLIVYRGRTVAAISSCRRDARASSSRPGAPDRLDAAAEREDRQRSEDHGEAGRPEQRNEGGPATSPPMSRPRMASARCVTGLMSDQVCSQPGKVLEGTSALLVNVSGIIVEKEIICTFSGLDALSPISTDIQDIARATTTSSARAPRAPSTLVVTRKPSTMPNPTSRAKPTPA